MRALLDSGVWLRRYHGLPMSSALRRALAQVTEWNLASVSIAEILYKWRHKRLPVPDPAEWLEASLQDFTVSPLPRSIAVRAALWDWPHGDPADRIIAATAAELDLTLIHTDTTLRELPGFEQRYCAGA